MTSSRGGGTPIANKVADDPAKPTALDHLTIAAPTATLNYTAYSPAGAFSITVSALNASGVVDPNYRGTVTFTTSDGDPGVVIPHSYTFTAADHGSHTFTTVELETSGYQSITATDASNSAVTGTAYVKVNDGVVFGVVNTTDNAYENDPSLISSTDPYPSNPDLNAYWAQISAGQFAAVSATVNSNGDPVLFAILSNGNIWENNPQFSPGNPNPANYWKEVSPGAFTAIGATRNSNGDPVVFAISSSGGLYENNPEFGNPRDTNPKDYWQTVVSASATSISATQTSNGDSRVFVIGSAYTANGPVSGVLELWVQPPATGNTYNTYVEVISPGSYTAISATRNTNGNEVVYGIFGGLLYENNPQFNPNNPNPESWWELLSSNTFDGLNTYDTFTAISATQDANGNPVVYGILSNGQLAENNPEFSSAANNWQTVSTGTFAAISASRNVNGDPDVFAILSDTNVWENNDIFSHNNALTTAGLQSDWLEMSPGDFIALSAAP